MVIYHIDMIILDIDMGYGLLMSIDTVILRFDMGYHVTLAGEALPSSAKHPGLTSSVSSNLGLTLVHFTAQRKHILWDSVGYVGCIISPQSIELGDTGRCDQDGLG
jgi:hypothetical protein